MSGNLDEIESRLRARLADLAAMRSRIKFLIDESPLCLDATQSPPTLTRGDSEADCTITMTGENMLKLLDGQLNPTIAYTLGKLKVQGSMGLALKLSSLLED
jgi:putative sterol carrier protein